MLAVELMLGENTWLHTYTIFFFFLFLFKVFNVVSVEEFPNYGIGTYLVKETKSW